MTGLGNWPVIHQIAWVLGKLMDGIYRVMNGLFGIQNIGVCIIIFTIIIYMLMLPLTIQQQRWSKLSSVMTPELQKVQKKYAGKRDEVSMEKQQKETQAIYDKYGTSTTSGCLPMLIQMPILFSLYPVIQNIPAYVSGVKDTYMPIVERIMSTDGFQKIMETIGSASPISMSASSYDYAQADTLISVLYRFPSSAWNTLTEQIPAVKDIVDESIQTITRMNTFIGINIAETPWSMFRAALKPFSIGAVILAIIIPVMAGVTQFISVRLTSQATASASSDNAMSSSMQSMNYTMPLISVFFGFTLPAGLGLYWAISALVRSVQQVVINRYLNKIPVEDLIAESQEKAAKKNARKKKRKDRKKTSSSEVNRMATTSTRGVTVSKSSDMTEEERNQKMEEAEQRSKNAKPGSLTARANLVNQYNNAQSEGSKPNSKEKPKNNDLSSKANMVNQYNDTQSENSKKNPKNNKKK